MPFYWGCIDGGHPQKILSGMEIARFTPKNAPKMSPHPVNCQSGSDLLLLTFCCDFLPVLCAVAVISTILGLILSFDFDLAPGGTIVLTATVIFLTFPVF